MASEREDGLRGVTAQGWRTAETKGGGSEKRVSRKRRTGRVERTRCPRGQMKGRLPATTY